MNGAKPPLPCLTALRFWATAVVFLHHRGFCLAPHLRQHRFFIPYLYQGPASVSFFFVLSGFILAYNYHSKFGSLKWQTVWPFYASRFARVYPVYLLTTVLGACLLAGAAPALVEGRCGSLVAVLTLTQSLVPGPDHPFAWNPPAWSVSDECFFYPLLPGILWVLARPAWRQSLRLPLLAVGLSATAFVLAWTWRSRPDAGWLCYINPLFRLLDFAIGVALGIVVARRPDGYLSRLSTAQATALELFCLAALVVAAPFAPAITRSVKLGAYYTPFVAALIFVFAQQRGTISLFLGRRPFVLLGESSYSFYLLHWFLFPASPNLPVQKLYAALGLSQKPSATLLASNFLFTVGVSLACYFCYEMPLRSLLLRRLRVTPARAGLDRPCVPQILPQLPGRLPRVDGALTSVAGG